MPNLYVFDINIISKLYTILSFSLSWNNKNNWDQLNLVILVLLKIFIFEYKNYLLDYIIQDIKFFYRKNAKPKYYSIYKFEK